MYATECPIAQSAISTTCNQPASEPAAVAHAAPAIGPLAGALCTRRAQVATLDAQLAEVEAALEGATVARDAER